MVKKRCAWGSCKSDNRYMDRDYMQGVTFAPFPKPKSQLEKCKRWIRACGRPKDELNVDMIGRHHFVCSKHFANGIGPTDHHPDPLPADPGVMHRRACRTRGKHRPVLSRQFSSLSKQLAAQALIMLHEPQRPDNATNASKQTEASRKYNLAEERLSDASSQFISVKSMNSPHYVKQEDDVAITPAGITPFLGERVTEGLSLSPSSDHSRHSSQTLKFPSITAGSPFIVIEPTSEESMKWSQSGCVPMDDVCKTFDQSAASVVSSESPILKTLAVLASQLSSPLYQDQLTSHLPLSNDCLLRCTNCQTSRSPTLTEIIKILAAVSKLNDD